MNSRAPRRSPVGRYYRDRSSSRERPRTRTYSDEDRHSDSYPSDYSDDFEPDTKSRNRTPARRRRGNDRSQKHRNGYGSNQYSSTSELHSSSSKKTTQSIGRRTYVKQKRSTNGWRSDYSDRGGRRTYHSDVLTSRLLSAKQRRINDIQNELSEAQQRLQDVTKENKLLKTVQHRQDKALRQYQDVESDLPRLISQNFEEQKVLKTRLKKAQHAEKQLEEKLRENNDEMQKMEKTLRKLKKVVYDKNLGERSELARQLTNTENGLSEAERKIKELEKKLELMTSSYSRQIKVERQKHKETKDKLDAILEEHQTVVVKLKEKERALGVSNIYSLRNKDSSSVYSTPRKPRDVPISSRAQKQGGKRDNGKEAEPAAIEFDSRPSKHANDSEQYKLKELPSPGPPSPFPFPRTSDTQKDKLTSEAEVLTSTTKKSPSKKDNVFLTSRFETNSTPSPQPAVKTSIDFIEKDPVDDTTQDQDATGFSQPSNKLLDRKSDDDPFAEVAAQKRREEELRKRKQEEEELQKKKRLQEEREKLAEQQRKKAALLAKMRDIEQDEESPRSPPSSMPIVDLADASKPGQQIARKPKKQSSDSENEQKSKSERMRSLLGGDTDPIVENLHMGIPTTTVKKSESELSFGGYAPSIGRADPNQKPRVTDKKSVMSNSESDNDEPLFDINSGKQAKNKDLLSQLFGDQTKSDQKSTTEPKGGEPNTPRAKPVHSGYPWEKNVVTSTRVNGAANPNYKVKTGLQVKGSTPVQDDDIEELSL